MSYSKLDCTLWQISFCRLSFLIAACIDLYKHFTDLFLPGESPASYDWRGSITYEIFSLFRPSTVYVVVVVCYTDWPRTCVVKHRAAASQRSMAFRAWCKHATQSVHQLLKSWRGSLCTSCRLSSAGSHLRITNTENRLNRNVPEVQCRHYSATSLCYHAFSVCTVMHHVSSNDVTFTCVTRMYK